MYLCGRQNLYVDGAYRGYSSFTSLRDDKYGEIKCGCLSLISMVLLYNCRQMFEFQNMNQNIIQGEFYILLYSLVDTLVLYVL